MKVNPKLRARLCKKIFVKTTSRNFFFSRPCQKKVCRDHVIKKFVETMSKNVCQDHVCWDHVCQDHVCQNLFKSTCFVNMFCLCQHVLSTCFVNILFQRVSSICFLFFQHVLSTCFVKTCFVYMFCWHVLLTCLLTCFVNMFCQRVSIFLHFKQNFHKNLRQTTTTTKKLVGLRE